MYEGLVDGDFAESEMPTDYILQLKKGCQVIMVKNAYNRAKELVWANGDIGKVIDLEEDKIIVEIHGRKCIVEPACWEKIMYYYNKKTEKIEEQKLGTFWQFPLRLCYAMTIHKGQGQTYDSVLVDFSQCRPFECGQTYVALSRVKSIGGLYLRVPLTADDIKVSPEVRNYLNRMKRQQQQSA